MLKCKRKFRCLKVKDRRGYSHLKEEALDRTMWRNRFGGGFGPVVRQNNEWMNICVYRRKDKGRDGSDKKTRKKT